MQNLSLLDSLIENNSIEIGVSVNDWQDAINKCFKSLLENKKVNQEYINAIIDSTNQYGPYYIICPNVAMPHANPKFGSCEDAFTLITLKEPVDFFKNKINILIGFCAKDDNNHLEIALPQICAVFEDQKTVEDIKNSKSKNEIIEIIKKIDYMKYLR